MTALLKIPHLPQVMIEGRPFVLLLTFADRDGDPIDLSAWSGSFAVGADPDNQPITTATPTLTADGRIEIGLTDAQTLAVWNGVDHDGRPAKASWQLDLISPSPDLNQFWMGTVTIYPAMQS